MEQRGAVARLPAGVRGWCRRDITPLHSTAERGKILPLSAQTEAEAEAAAMLLHCFGYITNGTAKFFWSGRGVSRFDGRKREHSAEFLQQ
eukprot:COSAG04_NODE_794_length_10264_cov_35.102804_2_plen_90_part_00